MSSLLCVRVCTTGPLIHHSPLGKSSLHPPLPWFQGSLLLLLPLLLLLLLPLTNQTHVVAFAPRLKYIRRRRQPTKIDCTKSLGVFYLWPYSLSCLSVCVWCWRCRWWVSLGREWRGGWRSRGHYVRILLIDRRTFFFFAENQLFHTKYLHL